MVLEKGMKAGKLIAGSEDKKYSLGI